MFRFTLWVICIAFDLSYIISVIVFCISFTPTQKLFTKLFSEDILYLLSMDKLWEKRRQPTPLSWGGAEHLGKTLICSLQYTKVIDKVHIVPSHASVSREDVLLYIVIIILNFYGS